MYCVFNAAKLQEWRRLCVRYCHIVQKWVESLRNHYDRHEVVVEDVVLFPAELAPGLSYDGFHEATGLAHPWWSIYKHLDAFDRAGLRAWGEIYRRQPQGGGSLLVQLKHGYAYELPSAPWPTPALAVVDWVEFQKDARMRGKSRNEQSTWYSVYVICHEFPEVGVFDDWLGKWSADSSLYYLVWWYASSGVTDLALKSRVLELCDARESGRDRARESKSPGDSWRKTLQYDVIAKILMAAFYALRPFSLDRVEKSQDAGVPTKSSWHLRTFSKKLVERVANELEGKWAIEKYPACARLENGAVEGAITSIMKCACAPANSKSPTLCWTGFSLDEDEWRAVHEKASLLYRRGVVSVVELEEDGVTTVVRSEPRDVP